MNGIIALGLGLFCGVFGVVLGLVSFVVELGFIVGCICSAIVWPFLFREYRRLLWLRKHSRKEVVLDES